MSWRDADTVTGTGTQFPVPGSWRSTVPCSMGERLVDVFTFGSPRSTVTVAVLATPGLVTVNPTRFFVPLARAGGTVKESVGTPSAGLAVVALGDGLVGTPETLGVGLPELVTAVGTPDGPRAAKAAPAAPTISATDSAETARCLR